ncbi:MAG: trypsin-like serine protease [Pseudobdellovibrionaceae bacterium]|nr:trypsin-like serine protease [Pseudobdellovibrionaceae bacterium]
MPRSIDLHPIVKLVSGSFITLIAVSCGVSAGPETSNENVYGGIKTAPEAWSNVVGIISTERGLYCTGTAITRTVVITAAHCAGLPSSMVSVYVGNGQSGGAVTGQYQAAKIKASPKWDKDEGGYDIAYIVLKKPLQLPASSFTPVLTNESEIEELLAIGKTGQIVGFGERENGNSGEKFEVSTTITAKNDLEITLGGEGKDSCYGDSGGPIFGKLLNGEWRVYGVTSRGGECGTGGIYGLMHASICWVQSDSGVNLALPAGTCK